MTVWVYIPVNGLFSVGFYSPDTKWHEDSAWPTRAAAAARVHYLNGGKA